MSYIGCGPGALLITEPMFVPVGIEAEVLQHLQVLFDWLVEGGEIVADH